MKSKLNLLVLVSFLMLVGSVATFAQGPSAVIRVEAFSPQEIHDLGWTSPPSNGLKVVGKGELVYLSGHEAGGEAVNSYTWSLESVPEGSNAVLDSTDKAMTTFIPDTTGKFVVKLTITTPSGSAETNITITAANYVGVGTVGGQTPDASIGQCGLCHSATTSAWQETGHATMFEEAIDGQKSPYYRESCIECHTVGFNEAETADNGGFDDVAHQLGWTFPETLEPGNWDNIVTNFPQLATLANIQCENCHGPGSLHKGNKEAIDVTLDEGVCGRCHEEAPYHRKNTQWKRSAHSVGIGFAAGRTSCAECHSGYGFIHKVDPATTLEQTTGFPQISCQVCHDPHSAELEHQLRTLDDVTLNNGKTISFGGPAKLCMNCHKSRRNAEEYVTEYHRYFGPHYSNQTDMLAGTNAITFGMYIPSSTHRDVVEEACVSCHMAQTPGKDEDGNPLPGRDYVGEHTFAMHWDGGTPDDPSDDVDNVTPCVTCHGQMDSFEDIKAREDYDGDGNLEAAIEELDGLLEQVGMMLPPLGDPNVEVTPQFNALQLKAAYNYFFVKEDGSHGVHNYQYAINLLKVTKTALTYGILNAGTIEKIADVPNDQGKQVRIVWNRFGGDGVSDNPITFYALWRRVDDMTVGTNNENPVYKSFDKIPVEASGIPTGTQIEMDGTLWDFVGSVPAAGLDMYSTTAPTLFDSTKVDGLHWSVFRVSGHTAIPTVYAISPPDSGYSIDNLAPMAPSGFVGQETETGIALSWNEPVDEDFKYFALYRSTTSGFDPHSTEPLATITENNFIDADVAIGTTYYYRLSAFDFSGNESDYTDELATVVTRVDGGAEKGVPTDFALMQNFPNPFNPSTAIRFALPYAAKITLNIYNLQGILVRSLVSDKLNAGYHNIIWDGRDSAGQLVSAGTYICRLTSGSESITKKMVLLK